MDAVGVVLVLLGAALMVTEAHVPTHGAIAALAAATLTAGVVLVLAGAGAAAPIVVAGGITIAAAAVVFAWLLLRKSLAVVRRAVRTGPQALAGRVAVVREVPAPVGRVQLDGALWRARMWNAEDGTAPPRAGSEVIVESIDGLTLTVRPADEWEVR